MRRAWGVEFSWQWVTGSSTSIIKLCILYILQNITAVLLSSHFFHKKCTHAHTHTHTHTHARARARARLDWFYLFKGWKHEGLSGVLWLHAILSLWPMPVTSLTRKAQLYWRLSCYSPTFNRTYLVTLLTLRERLRLDVSLVFLSARRDSMCLNEGLRLDVRLVSLFQHGTVVLCVYVGGSG